ncbi:MAG TPA: response regulator [Planctomycetota bacterium]|nr:response regulator [Planctomycetota bacterium]HRT93844.1 response regulator [Planctomycetota bacterium]
MSGAKPRVLIIEDEKPIRGFLSASLAGEGHQVVEAETGREGLAQARMWVPEIVILDLGLPDLDGLEVIRELREWSQAPIVILSAREQERDKVAALDAGADDYLTKPFGIRELLARVRVALRHAARGGAADATPVTIGDFTLDTGARRAFAGDHELHLTPIEYKLLTTLVRHAGKVLTHRFLLKEVWGPLRTDDVHCLRVFMAGLRQKIEVDPSHPRYLLTEQGVGYRFADE